MKIRETGIKGLLVVEPKVFEDDRGYFFESYNKEVFDKYGLDIPFVQDNQSKSCYGVIRGLHYQLQPYSQTKLIRVLHGNIYDVAVDIRIGSPTFGKWFGIEISEENKVQLLVPKGFAHGFSVLSNSAVVYYKCDTFYNPQSERGIIYNDQDLNIDWKIDTDKAIISDKDLNNLSLHKAEMNFIF
ncbi:MAG: dTDP-4-dehydrorhamnose 3,5-epimerase [Bacteroidales bacterium]|nr:dTDP-4-dehydrorhamnose 3,5-epimerase [Bacteroidales bacterium]